MNIIVAASVCPPVAVPELWRLTASHVMKIWGKVITFGFTFLLGVAVGNFKAVSS